MLRIVRVSNLKTEFDFCNSESADFGEAGGDT